MLRTAIIVAALMLSASCERLKVSLYTESLSPYTKQFMARQFFPSYQQLKDNLEVDIVPYGVGHHTHIDGVWNFQCLYGQKSCYGNRVQTCALAQNAEFDTIMSWFYCIYKDANPTSYLAMMWCAESEGLSWDDLEYCSTGSEMGYELLAEMGDKTHAVVPEIKYVPTIIFNDVYDEVLQNNAESDFFNTVCELFKEKPEACL